MITVKEAAERAASYLAELVPLSAKPLVEEVELSNDRSTWNITLSYLTPNAHHALFGAEKLREQIQKQYDYMRLLER